MTHINFDNTVASELESTSDSPEETMLQRTTTGVGSDTTSSSSTLAFAVQVLHPFYTLPAELILEIVDLLPPESFINFAFANYPLLAHYGLAPALSRPRVLYLTTQTQIPAWFPLLRMPAEITLQIMSHLKPLDIMRFVVANYRDLERHGIAPPLTRATVQQLQNAVSLSFESCNAIEVMSTDLP